MARSKVNRKNLRVISGKKPRMAVSTRSTKEPAAQGNLPAALFLLAARSYALVDAGTAPNMVDKELEVGKARDAPNAH